MTVVKRSLMILVTVLMLLIIMPTMSWAAYPADNDLIIPADVTEIGSGEYISSGIESVTFMPGSKLERIKYSAFENCTALTDITIPAGVKEIGERAFNKSGLESITFLKGSKLEVIGNRAFDSCENLRTITIPASTKVIGDNAFFKSGLRSVVIEKGSRLETIGENAFENCADLKSITIPANVTSISKDAFISCPNLHMIHYIGTQAAWESVSPDWYNHGGNPDVHFVRHRITKATPETYGEEKEYCSECKEYLLNNTIEKPERFTLPAASYTYDGSEKAPDVTVTDSAGKIINESEYEVSYSQNIDAGTATATVTFTGDYYAGSKDLTFAITPASVAKASVSGITAKTYNGKAQKQNPVVKVGNRTLKNGTDYSLSYKGNTNAGTATMTITGKGNYNKTKSVTFTINKAANPLKIEAKTATVKYAGIKKKAQTLAVGKVITFTNKGQGVKTYTKMSGNKKITINKSTGKVTVNKGLKKSTYKVKVKVKAAGNANYKASAVKTVTFTVKVK